jgi:tetratricopeptide (TPR) repeat protein
MGNILIKYRSFWICLALTLATTAVFYQVCTNDFVNYDDPMYVYENPNIQAGITPKAFKWVFTAGYASNWHPLTWLSHMLDWQLFGPNPAGHHLTNLIFHIANTLLLFVVLKRMTHTPWPSAFVAALFALHPLHVESVAWISERKDVLSTLFWLLTMAAYLRYVKHPGVVRYLLTLLTFAMGLMAKPMLVTLPFVLLLLDYWPLARVPYGQAIVKTDRQILYHLIQEKIPFFALSAVSSAVTFLVQRSSGAVLTITMVPLKLRIYNAIISYVEYIGKMVWPSRLAVFYPYRIWDLATWQTAVSLLLLLAISILVLRLAAGRRYLLTGWLWYLGTLLPVIGLIQVGSQALADRYTYITLTGLFIIIAWGLPDLLAKWRYKKITLTLAALLVILIMSICTHFQLRYWRNSLTLFQHAIDVTKDNYIAHLCIGEALYKQHRLDEAIMEYKKYLQIRPDKPDALHTLGIALGQQGKFDEAIKYLTKALQIKPDFAEAHVDLGYALALQGNLDEAFVHLAEAIRLDPNSALVHHHLGQVLVQMGKINEAITHLEEALQLKPDWVELMNDLAWYLATYNDDKIRNPTKAIRLAKRACELTNNENPGILDTLAAAYAADGRFSQAIETAEKALELCQSSEQNTLKEKIKSRLVLYKAGKPYIEAR